ncbi:MAG: (Fe-S)-binding protein [Chloroflexi bacterium]|nr:(Fe-S)-binding protein [Chloroflexota bacterium]
MPVLKGEIGQSNFLAGVDRPDYDEMTRCTHCGMCLQFCPTYRVLGLEADSPRGRIYQMRAVAEGRALVDEDFAEHMYVCLACRACETACPAHLHYGSLVEAARGQIEARRSQPWGERLLRFLIFAQLFPYPARIRLLAGLMRLYQISGLRAFARFLPGRLARLEPMMPTLKGDFFPARDQVYPARGVKQYRVALFNGCIMPVAFGPSNAATVKVLTENGCEVVVPSAQTCCGAIDLHAGERDLGREVARRNIQAFERLNVDAVIINAAGCGVALKEYGDLLHEDPAFVARAQAFAAKVKDVNEFLANIGFRAPTAALPMRVTYQDPCHLVHGQNIRLQPRQLLQSIPGLELVEMAGADRCCGSAGIYNITQTDLSMEILDEKMEHVRRTGATAIVSANPGCMLQMQIGCRRAGIDAQVYHVVDLLAKAYNLEQSN